MNHKDVAKKAFDLNKATFDAVYEGILIHEKYTEKLVNILLDNIKALPKEGREKIEECGNFYKNIHKECKKTVDDSFKRCYELVEDKSCDCRKKAAPEKAAPAETTEKTTTTK